MDKTMYRIDEHISQEYSLNISAVYSNMSRENHVSPTLSLTDGQTIQIIERLRYFIKNLSCICLIGVKKITFPPTLSLRDGRTLKIIE